MTYRSGGPAQPVYIVNEAGDPVLTSPAGGGDAVTVADGADVTQGAKADAAVTNPALSASEIALLKGLLTIVATAANQTALNAKFADDSTDRVRVSLYGNSAAAGDVAVKIDATGRFILVNTTAANDTVSNTLAGLPDTTGGVKPLMIAPFQYNGSQWERLRIPNIFKTATATASGDTALWTPTSGKKFRLMRFRIEITADAATAGGAVIDIVLRDATTGLAAVMSVFVPAIAGTAFGNSVSTGWIDWGNGYLSTAANAVLNINLSAALTSGKVRVIAAGAEE